MNDVLYVVQTGVANTASIIAAFQKLGVATALTAEPEKIHSAQKVLLPGVGSFGTAIAKLDADGLSQALKERIQSERSTACICLGLQLLFRSSEESPGIRGFSLLENDVKSFPKGVRVPHFGWNIVESESDCRILKRGFAYFANSFRLDEKPASAKCAWTDYGGSFVSAFEWKNTLACQFHPELSGRWGLELLERWVKS